MKNPNPSYSWKTVGFGLLLTALFLIPSGFGGSDTEDPWARGASYDLSWFTIGAGGVRLKTGDGVFELRGSLGFLDESALALGMSHQLRRENLQGNLAVQIQAEHLFEPALQIIERFARFHGEGFRRRVQDQVQMHRIDQ